MSLVLFGNIGNAGAQEQEQQPVTPVPAKPAGAVQPRLPLVARAPSRGEWTVRYSRSFDGGWESSDGWEQLTDTAVSDREVRRVRYSKDGDIRTYRIRTDWSDGTSEDEWIIMGNHVAERAGGRGLYIVGAEQTISKELGNKTDFPELNWAEMPLFKGIKSYKGRPVFVFGVEFDKKRLSASEARMVGFARQAKPDLKPSEVLKPKVSQVVLYLDVETQLPVLYNDGSVIRRYDFSAPPAGRLQPPKRTLDFLRNRADFLEKRLAAPSGPGG